MTKLTQPPGRLLTVADYAALGEDDRSRCELQEGSIPTTLVACLLAGAFGYQDRGEVRGVFESVEPFPARIDLSALV